MARERLPAKAPYQTSAYGGSTREVDGRQRDPIRDKVGGHVIHERNLFGVEARSDAEVRGGFEWTGRGLPLRIPTVVKVWLRRQLRKLWGILPLADWLSLAAVGGFLVLVWMVLWNG
jgi:hypothetical protein